MEDEGAKARHRLVELLQENDEAVPFIIGYITYGVPTAQLERAVDAYFAHDEQMTAVRAAARLAAEAAHKATE